MAAAPGGSIVLMPEICEETLPVHVGNYRGNSNMQWNIAELEGNTFGDCCNGRYIEFTSSGFWIKPCLFWEEETGESPLRERVYWKQNRCRWDKDELCMAQEAPGCPGRLLLWPLNAGTLFTSFLAPAASSDYLFHLCGCVIGFWLPHCVNSVSTRLAPSGSPISHQRSGNDGYIVGAQ